MNCSFFLSNESYVVAHKFYIDILKFALTVELMSIEKRLWGLAIHTNNHYCIK